MKTSCLKNLDHRKLDKWLETKRSKSIGTQCGKLLIEQKMLSNWKARFFIVKGNNKNIKYKAR